MDFGRALCYFRFITNPITIMKNHFSAAAFILCAALTSAHAQPGMMGAAPHGLDFAGATGKLFGDNSSFSATLEMQTASAGTDKNSIGGSIAVSDGKSRFEMDMTKAAGSHMSAQQAASMQSMGMGKIVVISRPDLKVSRQYYPGLNAYVENSTSDAAAPAASTYKTDITKLGEEAVDGHPCVKNKVVVTDDKGVQHESTVWNATDAKNFPVKIEQTESGTTVTMLFHDIKLDKVPADKFEVPAGTTKYDNMGAMMQQEMMKRAMQNRGNP
jgi:hypothetical protein